MKPADALNYTFVTVPALQTEEGEQAVIVSNTATGTRCEFGLDILEILEFFRTPRRWRSSSRGQVPRRGASMRPSTMRF